MSESRRPWWRVNAIFDPDGGGSDFSYTVGLAQRDLPELHMWARPTVGDDPGADWHFSMRDTCGLLNQAAWRLTDGSLKVGDTWDDTFDEGYVTARFTVGPAVSADDVDAFQAEGSMVLPIRWELVRPPIGAARELDPAARQAAQWEYDDLLGRLGPEGHVPDGWALPTEPSWAADQRFGPRTPMVLARAAEIRQARTARFVDLLDRAMIAASARQIGYADLVARAAAREPGRSWALERLEEAAYELSDGFGATWGIEQRHGLRAWMSTAGAPPSDEEWVVAVEEVVGAITTCLLVEAMADVLPDRIVTLGQGIVRTAIGRPGVPPDARWSCSESVAAAVLGLVTASPAAALTDAARSWAQRSREPDCWAVTARMWTGAHYPPRVGHDQEIQAWAHALATILAERQVVGEEAVAAYLSCAPGVTALEELVNTPIVADPRHPLT